MRVDHVIYAVVDLEAAGTEFAERYGLASLAGGTHPDWGTANRIVPLGDAYLELVAVADAGVAASSGFGRPVLEAAAKGGRLVGWAVATDDVETVARRLSLDTSRGSRTRPDGSTLSWRLAGVERAMETGAFPFFIEWEGPPDAHPGAAVVEHESKAAGIEWLAVTAEESQLREWLGGAELPLRIADGSSSLTAVGIATPGGEIVVS